MTHFLRCIFMVTIFSVSGESFGSMLRTIHLINDTPIYEQDTLQCSYKDGNFVPENKMGGVDSL